MAVIQLVTLFENLDSNQPTRSPIDTRSREHLRISVNAIFRQHHPRSVSSPTIVARHQAYNPSTSSPYSSSSSTSSSTSSSPTSSPRSFKQPTRRHPYSPSPTRTSSCLFLRRHPSSIDLALEAERFAVGPESVGLALMEPRPVQPIVAGRLDFGEDVFGPRRESVTVSSTAMDGIFEVMSAPQN